MFSGTQTQKNYGSFSATPSAALQTFPPSSMPLSTDEAAPQTDKLDKEVKEIKSVTPPATTDADSDSILVSSRPAASAPGASDEKDPTTNPVLYLEPDFASFKEITPNAWIKKPETETSFLDWAESKERKETWLRKANADTDTDLLNVINGAAQQSDASRPFKVAFASLIPGYTLMRAKNIKPGEIHFTDNGGTQEIRLESKESSLHTLINPRHTWEEMRLASEKYITVRNITIVRIYPGEIGLALDNGQPVVLLPGRHAYNSPYFILNKNDILSVNDSKNFNINFSNIISIIRIQQNELGIAKQNSNPTVLLPGLHINYSASFQFHQKINIQDLQQTTDEKESKRQATSKELFYEFNSLSIVQVNRDQLGCALTEKGPALMEPGIYIRNNRAFKFEKMILANEQYINFYTTHILTVRPNEIALVWLGNDARILSAGRHSFNTQLFKFDGKFLDIRSQDSKIINHGNHAWFRVDPDEYGYGYKLETGKPEKQDPGFYKKSTLEFIFEKHYKICETHEYKGIHHVVVKPGEARVVTKPNKQQEMLEAGVHNFYAPNASITPPINLKVVVQPLHQVRVNAEDRTPLLVTGQISYRITDPVKLVNTVGQDSLKTNFDLRVDADLRQAFSMVSTSMLSPGHHKDDPEHKSDKRLLGSSAKIEGDNMRGQVCTNVLLKLRREVQSWGVEIDELAISEILFEDKEFEKTLVKATMDARAAEADFSTQEAKNAAAKVSELGSADRRLQVAIKNAEIKGVETEAERSAALQKAEQEAKAEAKKIELKAEAEANAIKKRAEAEAEAEARKIEAKATAETKAISARRQAEAEVEANKILLLAQAEVKAKVALAEATAKLAEAEAKAARLKAEAQKELNAVTIDNPHYREIKLAEIGVTAEAERAKRQTPQFVISGSGSSLATEGMFFGEGAKLAKMALLKPRRNSLPASTAQNPSVEKPGESKSTAAMLKR